MIKHIWSIICNWSSIDGETNSISLFNVLERLTVYTNSNGSVNLPIHYEIVSDWIRENEEESCQGKMRVFFYDSTNEFTNHAELAIDLNKSIFYRTRVKCEGISLKGPGKYKFVVEMQQNEKSIWEEVATLPLLVIYQPDQHETLKEG
jgi:hypothetical protein